MRGGREIHAGTNSIFSFRPRERATLLRVVSVTDVLFGSSIRLIAARDVRMSAARVDLLKSPFSMRSATSKASARFKAAASTSSRTPSSLRKLRKLLPRCLFLLFAVLDVGIFSLQSQGSVFRWSFPRFLDEAMKENQFVLVDKKENARNSPGQPGPNLPKVGPEIVHERHAQRPSKLYGHEVLTEDLSFFFR